MLYTKKGDNGTTKLFNCPQNTRISKGAFVFEILGTLDEINSSLGYAKALSGRFKDFVFTKERKVPYEEILNIFQQNLFCLQAELGGADMHVKEAHVSFLEKIIYEIETVLPPIKSFIVPGGGEVGSYLDVVRTLVRRAERELVAWRDKENEKKQKVHEDSITFLNRLSSALYAMARFANYQEGYSEKRPEYK
jgi:cob(I)alamin adenosyltransferase